MLTVYADLEAASQATAELFAATISRCAAERGTCHLVLSGGNTPKRTFEILAASPYKERLPWAQVHIYWSDERCVPPDNQRSNYRMARQCLLDHVAIPPAQIHAMPGAMEPDAGARQYEDVLRSLHKGPWPHFDLLLLGLGDNGHTASLFPATPVLHETKRWVASVHPAGEEPRLTLTAPVLNAGKTVVFLLAGEGKAKVLHEVLEGPRDVDRLPAQLVKPSSGDVRWLVDRAAAKGLADQSQRSSQVNGPRGRVVIGNDHAGYEMKQQLVEHLHTLGYEAEDVGCYDASPVDYPDYAAKVAMKVRLGGRGILLCGSGVGASIAANKVLGIRAAVAHDTYSAHQGVEHDEMNILVLGARVIGIEVAKELVTAYLRAEFSNAPRHQHRLAKVAALESTLASGKLPTV